MIDYLDKGARFNILDIFHHEENFDLKVWGVHYPQILLRDDYERLLKKSIFKKIEFYGDYEFNPFDKKKSDLLVIVAYKT